MEAHQQHTVLHVIVIIIILIILYYAYQANKKLSNLEASQNYLQAMLQPQQSRMIAANPQY